MTKSECIYFVDQLFKRFDESCHHKIQYDENGWWIEFKDMTEWSSFMVFVNCGFKDGTEPCVEFMLWDSEENYEDQFVTESLAEALDELELYVHEAVQFGYFYNRESTLEPQVAFYHDAKKMEE